MRYSSFFLIKPTSDKILFLAEEIANTILKLKIYDDLALEKVPRDRYRENSIHLR